jgi:hypothetical protein
MSDDRRRGCIVQPIAQKDKYGLETALAVRESDGANFLVNFEGVGYSIPGTEAVKLDAIGEPVDLADWIRTFGARLDSNHWHWYNRLIKDE